MSAMRLPQIRYAGKIKASPEGRRGLKVVELAPHKEGTQQTPGREEESARCVRGYVFTTRQVGNPVTDMSGMRRLHGYWITN